MCNDIKAEVENSLTGTACARHADRMANGRDRVYADNLVINQCRRRKLLDIMPARVVLYFLSWSGFLVSFMMRSDINMALVKMARQTKNATAVNITGAGEAVVIEGEFDWSPMVQSTIIGSFYCCYVLSQVVGGVATQYYGTKNVFGWSQFATAFCSLGIPLAASYHYSALIILRSIQGFASGLTWPAMYAIVSYWIPTKERSRFMSSFQGFSVGIGLTYLLCGFILEHWDWRNVFYTTGSIGMAWCCVWYLLAYNTPDEHPRISCSEYNYIQRNIQDCVKDGQGMLVPWKSIFKSLPAWSIGVTTFGRIWVHYTFMLGGPMYLSFVLGFPIQTNGLLMGSMFFASYLSSVVFCWIADYLVKRQLLSLTNVRKLFTVLSQIVPGILVLIVGYSDSTILVLILMFVAVSLITASYAGAMASIVDIAPNLAGPVLAFAQTIHMTASFVNPMVNGLIVTDKSDITQWQCAFITTTFISCVTYVMFQIYGTAEVQPWNYPPKKLLSSSETSKTTVITVPAFPQSSVK